MLDYDELNGVLLRAQAGIRAAECHGFLCGQLCVTRAYNSDVWHDYLLADIDEDEQLQACHTAFSEMASAIETQIDSPDLEFQPLLPDDNQSLPERGVALADWCSGFLSGLGTAGIGQSGTIPKECSEMIDDIARIARASSADAEDEEDERALTELIEYLRMGVMMLYQELPDNMESSSDHNSSEGVH
ncbi:MAG: hypothetical protein A2W28_03605 [Gammaproteobacteria bacterium RBG_16_51_14]|nr:MAG: hypothetical protein A2W28_03605 [Gammaproteobacteria bacterium RBG_16_51_14]